MSHTFGRPQGTMIDMLGYELSITDKIRVCTALIVYDQDTPFVASKINSSFDIEILK